MLLPPLVQKSAKQHIRTNISITYLWWTEWWLKTSACSVLRFGFVFNEQSIKAQSIICGRDAALNTLHHLPAIRCKELLVDGGYVDIKNDNMFNDANVVLGRETFPTHAPHLEEFGRSNIWTLRPSIDVSAVAVGIEEDHQAHDLGDPPSIRIIRILPPTQPFGSDKCGMFMLLNLSLGFL